MIDNLGHGAKMNSLFHYHSTVLRVLLLVAIFLFGYLEGALFKRRDWACATWFTGLAALTAWIVYPLSTFRICTGAIVFISGVLLMAIYYRRASRDKSRREEMKNSEKEVIQ
jgi:hypothetical protein